MEKGVHHLPKTYAVELFYIMIYSYCNDEFTKSSVYINSHSHQMYYTSCVESRRMSTHRSDKYVLLRYQMFCKLLYDSLHKSLLLNADQYLFTPFIRSIFIHLWGRNSLSRLLNAYVQDVPTSNATLSKLERSLCWWNRCSRTVKK